MQGVAGSLITVLIHPLRSFTLSRVLDMSQAHVDSRYINISYLAPATVFSSDEQCLHAQEADHWWLMPSKRTLASILLPFQDVNRTWQVKT